MPQNVGHRLLHDPICGRVETRRQPFEIADDPHGGLDAGQPDRLEQLTDLLAANGVRVVIATGIEELENLEPDLAVMVGHYVLSPSLHSVWLRRDIPHLPVVVADGSVTVGPLIEPGSGPCLLCLELHHRDADAAWPAVASQLLGRRAFAEPALVASEAASLAARAVLGRLRGIRSAADSVRIDAASGERTTTGWLPHPECGCRGIAHLVAVAPASSRQQETGSPAAARPAPVPG